MRYWTHFKNGNKLYDAKRKKTFYAESIYRVNPENDKDISWACRIRECQNESGFAPRWWTTEIGFQTMSNGAARLTFVVSYADAMGFIGECLSAPDISVPGIVRNIQSDERFIMMSLYYLRQWNFTLDKDSLLRNKFMTKREEFLLS